MISNYSKLRANPFSQVKYTFEIIRAPINMHFSKSDKRVLSTAMTVIERLTLKSNNPHLCTLIYTCITTRVRREANFLYC